MFALVQVEDFDQGELYVRLKQSADEKACGNTGAIVTFTGLVRDFNSAGDIDGIELEHYPGMTEKALMLLVEQAIDRFSLNSAGALHRVGRIYNNEQIVWVGAAAPHRQAAFDAASYLMDMLKQSVPLWKKEFKGARSEWVAAKASDDKAALKWMHKK
ncbi:molybdenum cofactor biosynthesis protein MoaE [Alteromonas gracilis]|uniref:molybdenum cofactor biosynthesis protein MoaE n=1 Tax=Alteromonas gracilis TaxID=1479524 RepID=UPI0036F379EA